jgi:phage terminase small subunit
LGRPAKSLHQHHRERTFRADRHGSRVRDEQFNGDLPERPSDLSADEVAVWELVVNTSPDGVLRAIDATELTGCCWWYGEYCKAMNAMRPMKATAKAYYRLANLAAIAWKHFAAAASRFGMTPADRTRLKLTAPVKEDDDPLDALGLIGAPRAS